MGELNGKDRWDVITSPYTKNSNYRIVLGKQPNGAIIVKGPGSAFKTARVVFGQRLERSTVVDTPGLFTAKLDPISGQRGIRLTFEKDSVISEKVPRIGNKGKVFPL